MNIDYKLIGLRIKENRRITGLTQEQLAKRLDVTVGYVSQLERGISKVSLDTLGRITAVLDCDITVFLVNSAVNQESYLCGELIEKFRKLNPTQKKLVIKICDDILESL